MAYLTTTQVDRRIGARLRKQLCSHTAGTYLTTIFEAVRDDAEAYVAAAASNAGYTIGSSPGSLVMRATFATWLIFALGRSDVAMNFAERFPLDAKALDDLVSGKFPLGTPDTTGAIGGHVFSESSTSLTNSLRPRLGILDQDGW